ncbi:histidine kinase [Flavobacteriaceae bacterium R38]|nr:histidine kinase [Flavobacteriaceae bacterium R38]
MDKRRIFIDYILQNRVITHFLFWCSFFFMFTILSSLNTGSFSEHRFNYLAMLPSQIAAAYLLNYYQIPKLLFKKHYLVFGVSVIFSIYVFSALARIGIVYIVEPFVREDFSQETIAEILSDSAYLFSVYFPGVYVYAFLMLMIKAFKSRFEEKHKIEVLKKEKVANELKFLKAQIQPHFLFNTLNSLYALTLAKSDIAPKVVIKLSELLDFMLYQSNEKEIPIHKEVELIEDFISLEKLRYGDNLNIIFNYKGSENSNNQIAPFTLFPIVENAFKHGIGGNIEDGEIVIDLVVNKETLYVEVFNKKAKTAKKNTVKKGIGNYNLKRQLELNYPNEYQLEVEDLDDSYLVKLHIDLKG